MDGGTDSGTPSSATIYGGGFGDDYADDGYDADLGKLVPPRFLSKFNTGTGGVILYGGGLYAGVTGNTDVTIENGTFTQIWEVVIQKV